MSLARWQLHKIDWYFSPNVFMGNSIDLVAADHQAGMIVVTIEGDSFKQQVRLTENQAKRLAVDLTNELEPLE